MARVQSFCKRSVTEWSGVEQSVICIYIYIYINIDIYYIHYIYIIYIYITCIYIHKGKTGTLFWVVLEKKITFS